MRGGESRDIDRVVARIAIDRDGVGTQAGVEKSPMTSKVSPPAVPLAAGSTPLMRISSISSSSAMIDAAFVPLRVTMISVAAASGGPSIAGHAQEGRTGVDPVGLAAGIAVDHEGVAGAAFRAAVHNVATIGRSRRALAFQMIVSSPASPLMVSAPRLPLALTTKSSMKKLSPPSQSPFAVKRMADSGPI